MIHLLNRPADRVARTLLGYVLSTNVGGVRAAGRIVETEAYVGPHDPASHAAERTGRTRRNRAMFGPAGTLYVYLSYGMHVCANVVTGRAGYPAAVLIRALEPLDGHAEMARRRGRNSDLCSGPGRLCEALGVRLEDDGTPLNGGPVRLEEGPLPVPEEIGASRRIGISRGADLPLRFYLRGHPAVKPPRH
ncbi:MAG: DNA-3-methyladenine glycosylase [Gemmatimonadetes bacterium]|nr:DNA-3-methyladenine glycosylase [Gemmatimonadota bacterium]